VRFTWITCLLFALTVAGCGGGDVVPDAYRAAQQKWNGMELTDYHFTLGRECFCGPQLPDDPRYWPLKIVVRGGAVVSATYDSGLAVEPSEVARLPSMANLFEMGVQAYASEYSVVSFVANAGYGFLEVISIDRDTRGADDEIKYLVWDLAAD